MTIEQKELGQRLRQARKRSNLSQADVASFLDVSRSTVAQMELGNRSVSSTELNQLASFYGESVSKFLRDPCHNKSVTLLFRIDADLVEKGVLRNDIETSLKRGQRLADVKERLGLDTDASSAASYRLPTPTTKWQAIQQGEEVAAKERRRLDLGSSPLPDVAELLEGQGITTLKTSLRDTVSGFTLFDEDSGVFVVVNADHGVSRRRFSFAHEYCHVLLDRELRGTISHRAKKDDLREVRANAFAASFLLPENGLRSFLSGSGKDISSRRSADLFEEWPDHNGALSVTSTGTARARKSGGSELQLHDLVRLARHFRVSRIAALFRLRNLGFISEERLDALRTQEAKRGRDVERLLYGEQVENAEAVLERSEFLRRYISLAIDAYSRCDLSKNELSEVFRAIDPELELGPILKSFGIS